jgi:hypothetical protein
MSDDTDRIYAKLAQLELEIINLRQGYVILNKRYAEVLGTLKDLTLHAMEAAKRAAAAAEHGRLRLPRPPMRRTRRLTSPWWPRPKPLPMPPPQLLKPLPKRLRPRPRVWHTLPRKPHAAHASNPPSQADG